MCPQADHGTAGAPAGAEAGGRVVEHAGVGVGGSKAVLMHEVCRVLDSLWQKSTGTGSLIGALDGLHV